MTTSPTVWLVSPPLSIKGKTIDISAAERWGRIQIINRAPFANPDDVLYEDMALPLFMMDNQIAAAQQFNPMTDYLLMIGDNVQVLQFGFLLAQRYQEGFWVLRWDRKESNYYAIKMLSATIPITLTRRTAPALLPT